VGGVIIHDDAPVENEVCIMNDAAPVRPAGGIPPRTPPRVPQSLPLGRIGKAHHSAL
jgi:hypothetical protein